MQGQSILSPREREVLIYFAHGLTYRQIARRMGIATNTVDTYMRRIRDKSGVTSSAELVRLAISLEPVMMSSSNRERSD
jgi:DNA-binding CsgD family transcriptional regulator